MSVDSVLLRLREMARLFEDTNLLVSEAGKLLSKFRKVILSLPKASIGIDYKKIVKGKYITFKVDFTTTNVARRVLFLFDKDNMIDAAIELAEKLPEIRDTINEALELLKKRNEKLRNAIEKIGKVISLVEAIE